MLIVVKKNNQKEFTLPRNVLTISFLTLNGVPMKQNVDYETKWNKLFWVSSLLLKKGDEIIVLDNKSMNSKEASELRIE